MRQISKNVTVVMVLLLGIGLVVLPGAFSSAPHEALAGPPSATDGGHRPSHVSDETLIRFQPGTTGAAMAAAHAAVGSSVAKAFSLVDNLHLVKLGHGVDMKQALEHYRQHPNVLYAEPNWIVEAVVIPNDTSFGQLWGLLNTGQSGGTVDADIDATNAWDLTTGSSSVVVTVIDTGVDYTHPDLSANMFLDGYDFVNNDGDPMDDNNHGTHVSGTIGAAGNNSQGVVGVNWNVKIMACKFLNSSGSGTTAGAISCMDYVKTMKDNGVNIIATNNSWGGGGFSQALLDAIEAHHQAGILFIAAAGNSNSNNDLGGFYPASYYVPNLIAVAATARTDTKASFSSYGRYSVHLGAPGDQILSTTRNNTYNTFSGTSMATPHVAGVAALVKAQFPGANWIAIKNRILAGSENIASMASTTITGKRLNAYGALTCLNSVVLARLRPTLNTVVGSVGTPINLDALHINCAAPNGPVDVTVNPGNQVVTLQDLDGDGIYTGQWTPPTGGTYTLTFQGSDVVQVYIPQPYNYGSTSYNYRTIAGTSLNFGDDSTASITPGFPILFGGGSFNTLFVSSNGNVNFTTAFPDYANSSLTTAPVSAIGTLVAPFWDDLYSLGGTPQNVFWAVTGSTPNRELVIEWQDVRHYSCRADGTATARFQIVFFEGSSDILFNYADTFFGGACTAFDRGGSATIGVQTASNQATTFSLNSQSLTDSMALLWTIVAPHPPTAAAQAIATPEDTPVAVTLGGSDVDGDALTFTVVGGPVHGMLTGTPPNLVYTPAANYSGLDSFTFTASDATTTSVPAMVTITVTPVNDTPTANAQAIATPEDTPVAVTLGGSDVDGDALTFTVVGGPVHGMLTGTPPNLVYTPAANYSGLDSFTFTASDATTTSVPAMVTITVTPVNDTPTANAQAIATPEDTPVAVTLGGSDVEGNPLGFTITVPPSHGTIGPVVVIGPITATVTYTPTPNFSGTDSLLFTVSDGSTTSVPAMVTITVSPVNDTPTANTQAITTDEDLAVPIALTGSDPEGDPLTFTVVLGPTHGLLTGTPPNLVYTPATNYHGPDSFTFTASDATTTSAPATIAITVSSVNDTPTANTQTVATPEDMPLIITLTGSDVEGNPLGFTITVPPSHGTIGPVVVTGPITATVTYTPAPNFSGTDSLLFTVSDGSAMSPQATIAITVSSVNDGPVANTQAITTDEDLAVPIALTGSDPEGDPLTFTVVLGPTHGLLTGTPPNLVYTPATNYHGPDSFTFTASDATTTSAPATIAITVSSVNDTPTATAFSDSTAEDTPKPLILTGSDPEGNPLTFTVVLGPTHGLLTGTPPNLVYTPATNYSGLDSFTFTASDATTTSVPAMVTITVTPVNDTPTANAQAIATPEDTPVAVTLSGSDVDGDALTFTVVGGPVHGMLTGTPPSLTYTPAINYSGLDSFTFTASDATATSAPATVTITVSPVNGLGPPRSENECKQGGWKFFTRPRTFKNQGDCIQFVNTGK